MDDIAKNAVTSIERAMSAFLRAMEEIQKLADMGAVGPDIEDIVVHASELLDIVDEELLHLDPAEFPEAFEVAPILRRKLDVLRIELGIGELH